jgi:superfamily II DNA/RNA helicase
MAPTPDSCSPIPDPSSLFPASFVILDGMERDEIWSKYLETVPYELYPFQEEALLAWFESDAGVLICAPTGMGKTLVAEAAVFEALHARRRLYYTTPLIALTDQKFREFQSLVEGWGFSREDVGLITGNRRVNPDALIRVVVAEILLNHLLARDPTLADLEHVGAVVMDEFHNFNDLERGIVWELSLALLPPPVRVMLLSATVGNPYDFATWLRKQHGRKLEIVTSNERRVPLEFQWVEDKLLTEHLTAMVSTNDAENRSPALVFAFNRDECWDLAEKLKGLPIVSGEMKKQIEARLNDRKDDLVEGVGPKLRQMLIRGVGVHHAGVLPKHKEIVESLFCEKLVPFVCCTETLAAGINLPARSVVLGTLLKGKRGEKKLIPASGAHQMFGRAGRPQFDSTGYVFAVAHDDDVKINKWRKRYEQIDPRSKDPGIMRARKELERKRPTRRKTEQYWSEGQFKQLIAAGPARLHSSSMIPYQVLIYLLTKTGTLHEVRDFLSKRFATPERIEKFEKQLDYMLANLAVLGYLTRAEDGDHVALDSSIDKLLNFRSVDPLYGAFLAEQLNYGNSDEKTLALESVLQVPPVIERKVQIPDLPKGPLQTEVLEPLMIQMGVKLAEPERPEAEYDERGRPRHYEEEEEPPPTFPEMLKIAFDTRLPSPEPVFVQPKWIAGGTFQLDCEFFKFARAANLIKQEGLILRHLLRLVILAGEFFILTEDPDYQRIGELATKCCRRVDPRYTDRFLAEAEERRKLAQT